MVMIMKTKNKVKRSVGDRVFDTINIIIMLVIVVVVLYPVLNVVALSFSDAAHIAKADVGILPKGFTLESYNYVLRDRLVWFGYRNSIFYALASTALMLICTSMFAYPLITDDFIGKKFFTVFLTITMFFGGGLIPTYLLMKNMAMLDTVWVMILPGVVGAYNVFVFRTFFQSQPAELRESAQIDGANDFVILFRIVLPLSKALLATFGLFGLVGSWNSWFNGMLYLKTPELYPLQLILREYLYNITSSSMQAVAGAGGIATNALMMNKIDPKGVQMAMVVVTMFPIMMIYPFFQKYFAKGVMIGAVKG